MTTRASLTCHHPLHLREHFPSSRNKRLNSGVMRVFLCRRCGRVVDKKFGAAPDASREQRQREPVVTHRTHTQQ